jgi:tRNA/rRNA methyltransferase
MEAMLSEDELERVCVVLVRARNPSNIGAAARAMHDFGIARLRVVNEFPVPFEAARSAVDASEVMASAVTFPSVADAVGDCTLVVGTTAVGDRVLQHALLTLAEAAPKIKAELRGGPTHISESRCGAPDACGGRVALLFGSEKTGLSNEELSHCHWLLTVPMREHAGMRHPSMNLGQAVAVCLYELVRERIRDDERGERGQHAEPTSQDRDAHPSQQAGRGPRDVGHPVAAAANLERITALLQQVMEKTGYTLRYPHNADPAQVRRLVRRIGVDAVDAPVWMGMLKQILWKLGVPRGEE